LQEEKKRVAERKKEYTKAQAIKDPAERDARLAELDRGSSAEHAAYLPAPVLYPIDARSRVHCQQARDGRGAADSLLYDEYEEDRPQAPEKAPWEDGEDEFGNDDEDDCTGIPDLPLTMRVDIQGKFGKEKSVMAFQTSFGSLPAMATLDITEMMYASSTQLSRKKVKSRRSRRLGRSGSNEEEDDAMAYGAEGGSRLPKEIFLSYPHIMQSYSRWKMYKSNEFSMDALKKSGCESHMLNSIMNVVRNTQDSYEKLDLFNDYLQRVTRQHMSSVMNNDLQSTHAMFTAKYIEQGKPALCRDLQRLIRQVAPSFYEFMAKDKAASEV
jgi:hypothetical protein